MGIDTLAPFLALRSRGLGCGTRLFLIQSMNIYLFFLPSLHCLYRAAAIYSTITSPLFWQSHGRGPACSRLKGNKHIDNPLPPAVLR
jgi:hypothetical protein